MYDIIGDVHGNAEALKKLLNKLGYSKKSGYYCHPHRKAVFTGDFVNRGGKVRQTLKIVKRMTENRAAFAVMGNHEYNLICYHTKSTGRGYLRRHNSASRTLFSPTHKAFSNYRQEWEEYLDWMKQLPLFLEFEHFRVVHACWDKRVIKFVRRNLPGNRMTESFLHNSAREGTIEQNVAEVLLSGVEIPAGSLTTVINQTGKPAESLRIKWWMEPKKYRLAEVALGDYQIRPNRFINGREEKAFIPYHENRRPLFIGHYCLREEPGIQSPNICCVDYCCYRKGRLAAYRFDGELSLKTEKLVAV
ncbi:MAG: phosphoesterase [Marinilabiliales bacterium]|nr:MAG: phosphoesterase [Marinilabiliales bacterium]